MGKEEEPNVDVVKCDISFGLVIALSAKVTSCKQEIST